MARAWQDNCECNSLHYRSITGCLLSGGITVENFDREQGSKSYIWGNIPLKSNIYYSVGLQMIEM